MNRNQLNKEYFATHGYTIGSFELDGQQFWEAVLHKRYEDGDNIYADVHVTNLMYDERFAFSGNIGNQCYINTAMLYSTDDFDALYRLSHVRYDEAQNDFFPVNDFYVNKNIKVK